MNVLEQILREKCKDVKPSGKGFVLATCPVHKGGNERTPSLSVNLHTGKYKCFGCGIHGDKDGLKLLINHNLEGLNLKEEMHQPEKEENDNIDEAILSIFHMCPIALADAGFDESILKDHEVGFDMLYDRITFPIRDLSGRLVAISGRGPKGCDPRYKVYTHWMLRGAADKNYSARSKRFLYGGHTIAPGCDDLVVVEGYKACLWVRQAGFKHTVATMGTSIHPEQVLALQKLASRVIIFFDEDESGRMSGKKLQTELLKKGVPTVVVRYRDTLSPDDLTPDEIHELLPTQGKTT